MSITGRKPAARTAAATIVEVLAHLAEDPDERPLPPPAPVPAPVSVEDVGTEAEAEAGAPVVLEEPEEVLYLPESRLVPPRRNEPQRVVRVSVVEDEGLMRSLLTRSIDEHPNLRVVHSLPGYQEARLAITPGSTDIALLDISLMDGNGIALGVQLQRVDPQLSVVLMSGQDHVGLFSAIRKEMVRPWSYLSKRSTFTEEVLTGTLLAVARGSVIIDPFLVRRSTPRAGSPVSELTSIQFNVLRLAAEGLSNVSIAQALDLSPRSVESHLRGIYAKFDLDDETQNRRVAAALDFLEQTGRTWPTPVV